MNNLDVLRALAVLLVVASHALEACQRLYGWVIHPLDWNAGRAGVLLFFVHTSLVLFQSMDRLKLNGTELLKAFYIRRAFRIYPLAIAVVILALAFDIPRMPWEPLAEPSLATLAANLSLTMNLVYAPQIIGPMWSLPMEMQMYALLPFLFMWVGKRPERAAIVIGVAIVLGLTYTLITERLNVLMFAPCFGAGVLAHALLSRLTPRIDSRLWLPSLLLLIVAHLATAPTSNLQQWTFCILLGASIPLFHDAPRNTLSVCAHYTAQYSYGIYLFHVIGIWLGLYVFEAHPAIQWTIAGLATVLPSIATYHLLEKPATDLGAHLARRALTVRLVSEGVPVND